MDASRKETILDVFQDATPKATPLMTLFKTGTAKGTVDQWVEDYQARSTSETGVAEGADATYDDLTQPVRRTNLTQIITKGVKVSGTERAVSVVGGQDPLAYQKGKNLVGLKLKWENTIINSTAITSGASGTAATMVGINAVVTSHYTALSSGTSISVAEINRVVNDVFTDVGIENMFDLIVVPMGLKQGISNLSTVLTRYQESTDKTLNFPVQIWESDGGEHRIIPHADVENTAGTTTALFLRESAWQVAYLTGRSPFFKPIATQGDNDKGEWISEGTLRFLAERSNAKRTGFNQNG